MPSPRPCHALPGFVAIALSSFMPAGPAAAHHSAAIFDRERTVTLEGVVTRYEWVNPHVYLYVDVSDDPANPAIWEIEASHPQVMVRRGWSRTTFEPGDVVSVNAHPGKDGRQLMALGTTIETPDGRTLVMSRNAEGITAPGDEPPQDLAVPTSGAITATLAGTWATTPDPERRARTRQFLFAPDSWPLTDAGAAAVAAYNDSQNPAADCIAYTAPFTMVFPDLKRIELDEQTMTIRSALDNAVRTIHFDVGSDAELPPDNQGVSIGRWDGEALIVETTRFTPRLNGNAMRLPSSDRKRLVERFEIGEDRTRLRYRFELWDAEFLNEPVTGESEWTYSPDREFAVADCDLQNARRYLRGLTPSSSDSTDAPQP